MNTTLDTLPQAGSNKKLWAAIGVLGVAVLAMGATLIRIQTQPAEPRLAVVEPAATTSVAAVASAPQAAASSEVVITETAPPPAPTSVVTAPVTAKAENSHKNKPVTHASKAPAATHKAAPQDAHAAPATTPQPVPLASDEPAVAHAPAPAKPVCVNCGTVERVTAIEQAGKPSGLGVIAGGVLGAVVGNQVGRGDGRKLATVLGAVGGGMAGNAVEKNMNKTTHYQVLIRMEDGSTRTVEQATAPMLGTQVVVDGNTLHLPRQNREAPLQ